MEAASGSRAMMSCSEFSGEARPAWKTEAEAETWVRPWRLLHLGLLGHKLRGMEGGTGLWAAGKMQCTSGRGRVGKARVPGSLSSPHGRG